MNPDPGLDADEAIDAVSRRSSVIECLLDGPKYNRDVRDELDISRSTAYKAVSELEELDIARRCDEGYELTVLGRLLFEQYQQFHDRIADVCQTGSLLAVLPRETDVPFAFLEGANVYISEPHAPNRPVHQIERVIDEASSVKGTGPVVLPRYVELFSEQIVADELEAELVYARPVFEHLMAEYEEAFREAFESDNLAVRVTDEDLPYALLVVEAPTRKAGIVVYDDTGNIQGVVVNDTEQSFVWARDRWEQYRDDASTPSAESFD